MVTAPALHRQVKPFLRLFGPRALGWLTRYWLPIGKTVVVVGSGLHGCEIAEFLIKRGRRVSISPLKPNLELFKSLEGKAPEVYAIGDCREPRIIVDAIAEGWRVANEI